jgi:Restriction endonuclease XhoI
MSRSSKEFPWTHAEVAAHVGKAVTHYWGKRSGQAKKKTNLDAGSRGEVTGGQHLNAFVQLLCELIYAAGFTNDEVRFKSGVELPGYYRPTKKWDVVVIRKNRLCAAIELKSQVGPSFGNNFNNRTEEAVGSSEDVWTAFRDKLLGNYPPWLGYFFFLEDTAKSRNVVRLAKSVFAHDRVFLNTSYSDRYAILCKRMVLERKYNAATLLLSKKGTSGVYTEVSNDLRIMPFLRGLHGHLVGCV